MQIYPAIKARMGDWTYYVVRMTMREVAREVELAGSIWEDRTLSTAIQRMLDESRVKQQIVEFLSRRDDRFFSLRSWWRRSAATRVGPPWRLRLPSARGR